MDSNRDDNSGSHENNNGSGEESSVASSDLGDAELVERDLERVRNNDPRVSLFHGPGFLFAFQDMDNKDMEDCGRDISKNTYLKELIIESALEEERLSSLFRGLTRSNSIIKLDLRDNDINGVGLRSLEPFLQNSINLRVLDVSDNNIQNEGFNILWQALLGSPIKHLDCSNCGITSIEVENAPKNLRELTLSSNNNIQSEGFNRLLRSLRNSSIEVLNCNKCRIEPIDIDTDSFPRSLKTLNLESNRINSNGCHEIAKLLQEGGITLQRLNLSDNLIGDEGVEILVDALKTNTSLKELNLRHNDSISRNGRILILKLVNDISSIKATLQSNHTLLTIHLGKFFDRLCSYTERATSCNRQDAVRAGRMKVIETQLHSQRRAEFAAMQGVQNQSLYGEINPLHLPEVLSLVGRRHGRKELYAALKESIAELLSTVNKRLCLQRRRAYYLAMVEEIDSELAVMDSVEGDRADSNETRGIKRLRA